MLDARASAHGYTPQDEMYLWWLADPASPKLVGDLSLVDRGRSVALRYTAEWLNDGLPLSEDLPLEARAFLPTKRDTAVGAVDDARPDRWGERVIRALDKPPRLSLLEYLYFAGDNRFGALGVSLSRDAYAPSAIAALPTLADVSRIHDIVTKIDAGEPITERERQLITPGRSMGGARPKSLLKLDGAQWVLKFADAYDHDWPLIEHATMRLGRLAGIDMCETRAVPFAPGRSAIAVRRFDRDGALRHHSVSAGVALQAAGEAEGYPEFASLLRRLLRPELQAAARVELFRRMVFNILCDNTDDHERNHAIVLHERGYELSPAFDVLPTLHSLGYQSLRVGVAQMDSTLDNALSECAAFGLTTDEAASLIRAVCIVVADWRKAMAREGVSPKDLAALEPCLDGPKLAMRREFVSAKSGRSTRR